MTCFDSYFTAIPEGEPSQRHLYRASSNASSATEPAPRPVCLSCDLVSTSNETETEVSLLLRTHVIQRGGRKEVPLPTVIMPHGCMHNDAHFR